MGRRLLPVYRSRYTTRLRTLWGSLVLINKRGMRNLIYSFFSETASCAKNIASMRYIYICGAINIYIYGERERVDAVVRCTLQRCRTLPLSLLYFLFLCMCISFLLMPTVFHMCVYMYLHLYVRAFYVCVCECVFETERERER